MYSGVFGYVQIADVPPLAPPLDEGVRYNFGTWRAVNRCKAVDRTGFQSLGFQANVGGRRGATITLSGPFDEDMIFEPGKLYEFHLGLDDDGDIIVELVVTARVTDATPANDSDDAPKLDVTAESHGPFDVATFFKAGRGQAGTDRARKSWDKLNREPG